MTEAIDTGDWGALLRMLDAHRRGSSAQPALAPAADAAQPFIELSRRSADPLIRHLYAPLAARIARGPLVIGQSGQSLDGRIATETGHSHYINGEESLDHLHRLRALADAVIIGATTAIFDDPQLTVRRVAGRNPVRVLIDPNRRVGRDGRLFDDRAPTLLVAVHDGGPLRNDTIALPGDDGGVDPAAILAALAGRGLHTILVEGGARTLSRFLAAGCLHRLHVAVAPLILGSGQAGIALPTVARVTDALRVRARTFRLGDDVLFDCEITDRSARTATGPAGPDDQR